MALPPLNGDPEMITISGFAGGGVMANTMHMIFSDTIKGAGIHEGGPYGAEIEGNAHTTKDNWKELIKKAESEGNIELPLAENLKGAPAYVTSGSADKQVPVPMQESLKEIYEKYESNLVYVANDYDHLWPIDHPDSDMLP